MIITIGRECGCGGNTIGRMLADNYGIPFYDKKAIIEIALYEKNNGNTFVFTYGYCH